MTGDRSSRVGAAVRSWAPTLVAVTPLVVMLVRNALVAPHHVEPASDIAVLEIATRAFVRGQQLLGPYSRFGWHHPGPTLFGWYAPFWLAADRQAGGLAVAACGATVLSVGFVVRTLDRLLSRPAGWAVAAVAGAWCLADGLPPLQSPWNPLVIVAPTAALGVAVVALACGRRWALPVAVVLATFVVQTHVGAGPVVLGLVATGLFLVVARRRPGPQRAWWPAAGAGVACATALWAAPLDEQLRHGGQGNLGRLLRFFGPAGSRTAFGPGGLRARPAFDVVVHRLTVALSLAPYHRTDAPSVLQSAVAVTVVGGTVALAIASVRRGDRVRSALAVSTFVALVASVAGAASARGYLDLYLVTSTVGVALLAWTCSALFVVDLLAGRGRSVTGTRRPGLVGGGVAAIAVIVAGGLLLRAVTVAPWARPPSQPGDPYRLMTINADAPAVAALGGAASDATRGRGPIRLSFVDEAWPLGAGLIDHLQREGHHVAVTASWTFIFGDDLRTSGHEPVVLKLVPAGRAPGRGRYRLLGQADGFGLWELG